LLHPLHPFPTRRSSDLGSPPIRAVHVDLPAIRLDRPTRDGKAEANPIPRARLIDSIEAIEDALAVLGADARAGVDHLDGGPARLDRKSTRLNSSHQIIS